MPLSIMYRTTRPKINKEIEDLNNIINQLDLTDIYRALHPIIAEYTSFSSTHKTFSKWDHILIVKTNINKLKRTEIIQSMFYDHNGMKEINKRREMGKFVYM